MSSSVSLYASRVVYVTAIVYGSLRPLVPVFMAGLYFSWAILLFGAQVSLMPSKIGRRICRTNSLENVNQRGREFIALRLMTCIGHRFLNGLPPVSLQHISVELGIPSRLAQQVLQTLLSARPVVETGEPGTWLCAGPPRWRRSMLMTSCMHREPARAWNCPCVKARCARKCWVNFRGIEEAERSALRPRLPCSRSSIVHRPGWNSPRREQTGKLPSPCGGVLAAGR